MTCRNCGAYVPDYQSFGPDCGWPVGGGRNSGRKNNTLPVILGIVAVVVLIIGAFAAGRFLPGRRTGPADTNPQDQSAVVIPYTSPTTPNPAAYPGGSTVPSSSGQAQPVLPSSSTQQPYPYVPTQTATPYVPTQTATPYVPPSQQSSYYLIPDSDSRYLTEADLKNLSWRELSLARNEIYARHGRRFSKAEIQAYFDSQSWYYGTIEPADFRADWLSKIEYANIKLIKDYEKKIYGGNYF